MSNFNDFFSGGGGDFILRSGSLFEQISLGTSGTLAIITPPTGLRVRLTFLASLIVLGSEAGITVKVGGVEVIVNKSLVGVQNSALTTGNSFFVTPFAPISNTANTAAQLGVLPILGKVDEVIEIIKVSGSTTNAVNIKHEFGE